MMKRERKVKCGFLQGRDYNNTAGTEKSEAAVIVTGVDWIHGLVDAVEWQGAGKGSSLPDSALREIREGVIVSPPS